MFIVKHGFRGFRALWREILDIAEKVLETMPPISLYEI